MKLKPVGQTLSGFEISGRPLTNGEWFSVWAPQFSNPFAQGYKTIVTLDFFGNHMQNVRRNT
jgi:hypothetical protein